MNNRHFLSYLTTATKANPEAPHGRLLQAAYPRVLKHFLRDHGRLVQISHREHKKGIHWHWRNGLAALA
jgi:hypothetical protein